MNPYDHALLRFSCHFCGIELEVPVELGGETAPCPSCGLMITAPTADGGSGAPLPVTDSPDATWSPAPQVGVPLDAPGSRGTFPQAGYGQSDAGLTASIGDRMPPSFVEGGKKRGLFFPVTVGVLSAAILGLGGVLISRSELARPGGGGSFVLDVREDRAAAKWSAADAGGIPVREQAVIENRALTEAVASMWPSSPAPSAGARPEAAAVDAKPGTAVAAKEVAAGNREDLPAAQKNEPEKRKTAAEARPLVISDPGLMVANPVIQDPQPAVEALGMTVGEQETISKPAPKPQAAQRPVKDEKVAETSAPVEKRPVTPEPSRMPAGAKPGKPEPVPAGGGVVASAAKQDVSEQTPEKAPAAVPDVEEPQKKVEGPGSKVIPVAGIIPNQSPVPVVAAPVSHEESGRETAQDRAKEVIRRFLMADSWQQRVPFIFDGEAKQAALRDYFQSHPDRSLKDFRLDFFHSEPGKDGALSIHVFFLTLDQEEDGCPVIVKSDRDGKRFGVDWDLLVEFRDRHFAQFVEKKEEGSREFHVVIQRVTYWEEDRDQVPGIEDLVCYKIDPPYPGYTQYAFVEKGSDEGKRMVEALSWETDPLAAKVRVNWSKLPGGRPYLRVTDLVARTWANE